MKNELQIYHPGRKAEVERVQQLIESLIRLELIGITKVKLDKEKIFLAERRWMG